MINKTGKGKIIFFALRELHFPVLLPVYHHLRATTNHEIGFMAPPYQPSDSQGVQMGLSEQTRTDMTTQGIPFFGHEKNGDYDCIVTADVCYDQIDGWGPIVCIGHGTIAKNLYFNDRNFTRRENFATALCVPGPWYKESFGKQLFIPVIPTGFSKMDELAVPAKNQREIFLQKIGFSLNKKTLLFAPTFNLELTSLVMLFEQWTKLPQDKYQVIFKLHGATREELKNYYRKLCTYQKNFHYAEEVSLTPYVQVCDLMISDVSSAYVEFLVTGKPVIVANNPEMKSYSGYNPSDVEYRVREAAYQINQPEELLSMLQSIEQADPLAEKRRMTAAELFPALDGRNCKRIGEVILKVASGEISHAHPCPDQRMTVYLPEKIFNLEQVKENIKRAEFPVQLVSHVSGLQNLEGLPVGRLGQSETPTLPFICMTGEHAFPKGWDFLFFMAQRFNPGVRGILGPVVSDQDPALLQRHKRFIPTAPAESETRLQSLYKAGLYDRMAPVEAVAADGLIVTQGVPENLIRPHLAGLCRPEGSRTLASAMAQNKMSVGVLPGFLATTAAIEPQPQIKVNDPIIRVSAIVSTFKSERFMRHCLDDLEAQTAAREPEIIIIDSASPENEKVIVEEYQKRFRNIGYLRTEEREGLYAAWNRAIGFARGLYITNANTDDRHTPYAFEKQTAALDAHPDIALVYGDCFRSHVENETFVQNNRVEHYRYPDFLPITALLHFQFGPQPMWRKSVHDSMGLFDPLYKAAGDYDFNLRLVQKFKALHLNEPLGLFLKSATSITRRDNTMQVENDRVSARCREPELIEALYALSGVPTTTNRDKARLHLDLGLRALEIYKPWHLGQVSSDINLALTAFERSLRLDPEWDAPSFNIARVLTLMKRPEDGKRILEKCGRPDLIPKLTTSAFIPSGLSLPTQRQLSCLDKPIPTHEPVITPSTLSKPVAAAKKIRVLFVSHDFPPFRYAGVQNYALFLAKALQQSGSVDVEVLHPEFRNNGTPFTITEAEFEGIKIHRLHKPKHEPLTPEIVKDTHVETIVNTFLDNHPYDAVHCHSFGQLSAVVAECMQRRNIPTLLTLHDCWFLCHYWFLVKPNTETCQGPDSMQKCVTCLIAQSGLKNQQDKAEKYLTEFLRLRQDYLRAVFSRFHRVFPVSRFIKDKYASYGLSSHEVVPLGMQTVTPLPRQRHDSLRVGFIGQVLRHKGVHTLIQAWQSIDTGSAGLIIYGKSFDNDYLNLVHQLIAASSNIEYKGEYRQDQLPAILSDLDVVIVPSLMESYSLVVREAFQNGVPVLVSDAGALPEAVEPGLTGLVFRAGDKADLADKLKAILTQPGLLTAFKNNLKPVRTIDEDARFFTAQYQQLLSATSSITTPLQAKAPCSPSVKKLVVQFYILKSVHWPMFDALYQHVKTQPEVGEIIFCLPFLPGLLHSNSDALIRHLLAQKVTLTRHPKERPVDITFVADTLAGKVQGCGKIVNVGHGTISKGYYFTESLWSERENWADLLCVPGPYAYNQFAKSLKTRVAATGMPKMDPVFSGKFTRAKLCATFGLDPKRKIILYAPTFNIDLSSVYHFADRFAELGSPDRILLIKLHGSTPGPTVEQYRKQATPESGIFFIDDPDIAPYLALADIMISDVSSAYMEFMALDKPVILYDNPSTNRYHGYNPKDIEYQWRNLATRINDFDSLKKSLNEVLARGDDKSAIRKQHALQLFSDQTGHASEKVFAEVKKLLLDNETRKPLPRFSVPVVLKADNLFLVRCLLHHIQFYAILPMEAVIFVQDDSVEVQEYLESLRLFNQFDSLIIQSVSQTLSKEEARFQAAQACTGDYLLFLDEQIMLFRAFDYLIYKTLKAHPETTVLTSLTTSGVSDVRKFLKEANLNGGLEKISQACLNQYQGQAIEQTRFPLLPGLLAVTRSHFMSSQVNAWISFQNTILSNPITVALSLFTTRLELPDLTEVTRFFRENQRLAISDKMALLPKLMSTYKIFPFPDLAEQILLTMAAVKKEAPELTALAGQCRLMRFYDLPLKKRLLGLFAHVPTLVQELQQEINLLRPLLPNPTVPSVVLPKRILFYFFKNVHISILLPIYRRLKERYPQIEMAFSAYPLKPEIRAGLTPEERTILSSIGVPLLDDPFSFKPDITFIADSIYELLAGCGKLVQVGHGVLSKGQYYTDTAIARREEKADLVCVPGSYHAEMMKRIITKPVAATGMAKMDALFSGRVNRASVLKDLELPEEWKFILFAPTFNDELSAIPDTLERIAEIIPNENTKLVIKLHGSTKPEYVAMYRKLAEQNPAILFAGNLELTPFIALCDVCISDVSSAMMEFAAIDKPLILFNNRRWKEYKNYNPQDIEFRWRDIGIQVTNLEEMKAAVIQSFANPAEFSEKRRLYTEQLFANQKDGQGSDRILDAAFELMGSQNTIPSK